MTVDPPCNTTMAYCKSLGPFKNEAIAPSLYSIRTAGQALADADVETVATTVNPRMAAAIKRFIVPSLCTVTE
jgi:hypothetical protein